MKGKSDTMKNIFEIQDLKVLAKKKLPKMFYDYVDSGSFSQSTYRANEEDFKNIKLRQRVGKDISKYVLKRKILNREYDLPFGFSPCGMAGMLYPNAEILVAFAVAPELTTKISPVFKNGSLFYPFPYYYWNEMNFFV